MVVACRPECTCYNLSDLAATLPELPSPTPSLTVTVISITVVTSTPSWWSDLTVTTVFVTFTRTTSSHEPTTSLLISIATASGIHSQTQETSLPPAHSSGLSTGSKAGIGVGGCLGAALVFGLILWLFWALRNRRKNTANLFQEHTNEPELKSNSRSS